MPVSWTDVAPIDPFAVVAAGRAAFRLEDLCALIALLHDLHPVVREPAEARRADVK